MYMIILTSPLMDRLPSNTMDDIKSLSLKILNMKSNIRVKYFRHISNLILLVALLVGLYARWMQSNDTVILVISASSCFVFLASTILVYYFSMKTLGYCIGRLWVGFLLGIVSYTDKSLLKYSTPEEVMNSLFVSSLALRCFWNVLERMLRMTSTVSSMDVFEVLGVCVASVMFGSDFAAVCLMVGALALTVQAIRLKSFMAVLNLIVLCVIAASEFFPKILQQQVNPFPLICFVGRMAFEPVLDLYFSNLTMLERWMPIFSMPSSRRRLMVVLILVAEVAFYAFCAKQVPRHKEWFIVVPIFAAFSLVWWSCHIVFIITLWQLNNKITDCCVTGRTMSDETNITSRMLAARGVRHFSLITQRLVTITLVSTIILTGIDWITKSAVSLGLFFTVVPIEVVVTSLLWELGRILGGTCTGYALVVPITSDTREQSPQVLSTNAVQEMSVRATTTLNQIQHFLTYHLIDMFGCDYTSSGLTYESVEAKLRSFFQRVTVDGPHYDTYFIYYCGHVYDNGDWALVGNEQLKLERIIDLWREYKTGTGERLILVLDTSSSHHWVAELRKYSDVAVAIQTCRAARQPAGGGGGADPEHGLHFRVGEFTKEWVAFNCGGLVGGATVDWQSPGRALRALYEVSHGWAAFRFHMPTMDDMAQHWDSNFPRLTKPLITITNFPQFSKSYGCSDWLFQCLRRLRLRWLPPLELDTGHGFKLVRS